MMEQNKKEKNEKIIFGDWLVLGILRLRTGAMTNISIHLL
jgi:hypothetical protein